MKGINGPWRVGDHNGYVIDDEESVSVIDANGDTVVCNTTFYPT